MTLCQLRNKYNIRNFDSGNNRDFSSPPAVRPIPRHTLCGTVQPVTYPVPAHRLMVTKVLLDMSHPLAAIFPSVNLMNTASPRTT